MLICFGIAWPLANLRMLRSRCAEGKGVAFSAIILCGYVACALAKLALASHGHTLPPVFWLYALSTLSVGVNLMLQWRLERPAAPIGLIKCRRGRIWWPRPYCPAWGNRRSLRPPESP